MARVLLLIPSTSYRAEDFLAAAASLNVDIVVGSNHTQVLRNSNAAGSVALNFDNSDEALERICDHCLSYPVTAVIGTDDESVVLAAVASERLGLKHNPVEAVKCARDKYLFRCALERHGVRTPSFRCIEIADEPERQAHEVRYPCVLKPRTLSGSRGVIRADTAKRFTDALALIADILISVSGLSRVERETILVEDYVDGIEVAVEGLLDQGCLQVLAVFDKPDPLVGPYFVETIYVTPSNLSCDRQREVALEIEAAARAVGLVTGPIHAEARINAFGVFVIEIAPRTIGGLCSRVLTFSEQQTLEQIVLRQALGLPVDTAREDLACGVMMIPIERSGRLTDVHGVESASLLSAVDEVRITVARGSFLRGPPYSDQYLGFIFARGACSAIVEEALREAYRRLTLTWE